MLPLSTPDANNVNFLHPRTGTAEAIFIYSEMP